MVEGATQYIIAVGITQGSAQNPMLWFVRYNGVLAVLVQKVRVCVGFRDGNTESGKVLVMKRRANLGGREDEAETLLGAASSRSGGIHSTLFVTYVDRIEDLQRF